MDAQKTCTCTIGVRIRTSIRDRLLEMSKEYGLSNPSELYRTILTQYAEDSHEEARPTNACKQRELRLRYDNDCPLLRFVATERCNDCPYRMQPITSRESVLREISSPYKGSEDSVSRMIDELFNQSKKKT